MRVRCHRPIMKHMVGVRCHCLIGKERNRTVAISLQVPRHRKLSPLECLPHPGPAGTDHREEARQAAVGNMGQLLSGSRLEHNKNNKILMMRTLKKQMAGRKTSRKLKNIGLKGMRHISIGVLLVFLEGAEKDRITEDSRMMKAKLRVECVWILQ